MNLQHKKDIAEKDIEIGILLNNLNDMNKKNCISVNENKQQNTPKETTIDKISAEEDLEKGWNCNMCDFSSEVGFGLLSHHINKHCESLADKKHKYLNCGKTFAREVMISFQFFKHL